MPAGKVALVGEIEIQLIQWIVFIVVHTPPLSYPATLRQALVYRSGSFPPASRNLFRHASGLGCCSSPTSEYARAGQFPVQHFMYGQSSQNSKESRGIKRLLRSLCNPGWCCHTSLKSSLFILPSMIWASWAQGTIVPSERTVTLSKGHEQPLKYPRLGIVLPFRRAYSIADQFQASNMGPDSAVIRPL